MAVAGAGLKHLDVLPSHHSRHATTYDLGGVEPCGVLALEYSVTVAGVNLVRNGVLLTDPLWH